MENLNIDPTPPSTPVPPPVSASSNGTATAEPSANKEEPPRPSIADATANAAHIVAGAAGLSATPGTPARARSFAMLAGAVAVAAAFGSLAGALAATGFANWSTSAHAMAASSKPSDLGAMQARIEEVRTELG